MYIQKKSKPFWIGFFWQNIWCAQITHTRKIRLQNSSQSSQPWELDPKWNSNSCWTETPTYYWAPAMVRWQKSCLHDSTIMYKLHVVRLAKISRHLVTFWVPLLYQPNHKRNQIPSWQENYSSRSKTEQRVNWREFRNENLRLWFSYRIGWSSLKMGQLLWNKNIHGTRSHQPRRVRLSHRYMGNWCNDIWIAFQHHAIWRPWWIRNIATHSTRWLQVKIIIGTLVWNDWWQFCLDFFLMHGILKKFIDCK